MGGGRRKFLSKSDSDFKDPTKKGDRTDGRNLINEWTEKMKSKNLDHKFLWNLTEFMSLEPYKYDHILGLLNYDHMEYEIDRIETYSEPSIVEMTTKAIELLSKNPKGFYLLVEGLFASFFQILRLIL